MNNLEMARDVVQCRRFVNTLRYLKISIKAGRMYLFFVNSIKRQIFASQMRPVLSETEANYFKWY